MSFWQPCLPTCPVPNDMDNSKFDNMIPYGKQEVSYTYPKGGEP